MSGVTYFHAESTSLEIILTSSRAKRHYPWHIHASHWTIGLVISGSASIGIRKTKTPAPARARMRALRRGESFIVRPREVHCLTVAPKTSLAVLCLHTEKTKQGLAALMECGDLSPLSTAGLVTPPSQKNAADNAAKLSPKHIAKLTRLAKAAIASGRRVADVNANIAATPAQTVARHLVENSGEPLSISEMAALASASRWHFLRCFKKETGMTPHAFQLACRLAFARRLLRKNIAAADVATTAGFSDQSHMHRFFKRHHGLTPRGFLRSSVKLEPR